MEGWARGADTVASKRKETNEFQCIQSEETKVHAGLDVTRLHKVCAPVVQPGWVEKLASGEKTKLRIAEDTLKIGTWDVQTSWSAGKLELLRKEMEPYKCEILGLAEMRWTVCSEMNGDGVLWSGEDKEHAKGVDFLLSKRALSAIVGYFTISSGMMVARFGAKLLNFAVVQVYAPTADSTEGEIQTFYEQLEECQGRNGRKRLGTCDGQIQVWSME
jgi:hypothetical protein